ncbi:MAG: alpha/beta fold hydrolase [Propionibacteriales bacterium]|nr:alpha/beta fold hydrolase [Propionibacteriales bacterium]
MADSGWHTPDPDFYAEDFVTIQRTVRSSGVDLVVWETRQPTRDSRPTIVFVHGFPDTHGIWDPVIARLADRFHCVAYDVRGAGRSGVPAGRQGYAMAYLVSDLVAVLDAVSPNGAVHLSATTGARSRHGTRSPGSGSTAGCKGASLHTRRSAARA